MKTFFRRIATAFNAGRARHRIRTELPQEFLFASLVHLDDCDFGQKMQRAKLLASRLGEVARQATEASADISLAYERGPVHFRRGHR